MNVYSLYKREDNLCQTNGYFSLNVRQSNIPQIVKLLQLNDDSTVGWIGCGDGREVLSVCQQYPNIKFSAIDHNEAAIAIAKRVLSQLELKNIEFKCGNALDDNSTFSHVYSTAIYGPELYEHLKSITTERLCMLKHMWGVIPSTHLRDVVRLSGSGESKTLISAEVKYFRMD